MPKDDTFAKKSFAQAKRKNLSQMEVDAPWPSLKKKEKKLKKLLSWQAIILS